VIYNFPIGFCPCLFNIYGRLVRCNVSMDPIRYGMFTCIQKLTRWPALSSARHRIEK